MKNNKTCFLNCYTQVKYECSFDFPFINVLIFWKCLFCSLQIGFDAFSLRHAASWRNVMDWFHREVTAIENEARHFIDDSFKTLRSAEGAFDMLLNFRHIRSREAINSQMMKKFNDILVQFGKEV